jgi:membrane associated rhomboid family serine protease
VLQFVPALGEVAVDVGGDQGVAYFAHVGGFIFGLAVAAVRLYLWRRREPASRLPVY